MRTGSASLTQGLDGSLFLQWIASDPLDGTQSAEHRRQQIADCEVFDFPVATYSSDRRTLQEAVLAAPRLATLSDGFTVVSAICRSWIRFRYATERWECENSAHLHDVPASALRAQIFLNVRHVRPH